MSELVLSAVKILGSVALLAGVLFAVSRLAKRIGLAPEVARKLIHVSLGLYCLTFPWIFTDTWEVAATCALAAGVFALARGVFRASLGEGLHSVNRISYGELLFALAVVVLFELKDGHYIARATDAPAAPDLVLYLLPLFILTLCDAACAVVGSSYGRVRFQVADGAKSWEGVAVFITLAWLVSLIVLLLFSSIGRPEAIVLAFIVALFGALLEAASWRGLDNLFIPLGLYFILANLMMQGTSVLLATSAIFAATLAGVFAIGHRTPLGRHWLATAATLLFCISIFSGPESTLAPLAALFSYGLSVHVTKTERPPQDALNLILTCLALALGFFLFSNFAEMDTIFGFNLAFACLAIAIAVGLRAPLWALALVVAVAYAALSVRTLIIAGVDAQTLRFQAVAVAAMAVVAVVSRLALVAPRPWITAGGLSAGAGLLALMAAPA